VRRLALVPVFVLVLAACGSHSTTKGPLEAYTKFFSSKTPISERVSLLENGSKFKGVITSFANNPLASNTSATVYSVTLEGANKAKVVYAVKVGGASLGKQTGFAVRQNGTWKVGDASLCKLIALGGTTPSVCKTS
jgi:hypothetical protein